MTLFERLKKEARYAQASFSKELLYQVHGAADMAYELGGIDWPQCCELNDMTVRFMNTNHEYIQHQNEEFRELARFLSPRERASA